MSKEYVLNKKQKYAKKDKLNAVYTSEIQIIKLLIMTIDRLTTEVDDYSTQYYHEQQLNTMSFFKSAFKRGELSFSQYATEITLDDLSHNKT